MLLSIFALLVGISIVLIVIGLAKTTESAQALVGFFFLFLLSFNLIDGTIEYVSGYDEYYVYGNNFTGYHWDYDYNSNPPATNDSYLFHSIREDTYASYQNRTMGVWLALLAGFGFAGVFFSLNPTKWGREGD